LAMDADTFDAIIEAVSAGVAVRNALAERQVSGRQFYGHLNADNKAAERYARAKADSLEAMADEMLGIADEVSGDTYESDDGRVQIAPDVVQRARLRIDTRKWLLSKLAPKKYGDKLDIDANVGLTVIVPAALGDI
jgi:hypothetical protein